MLIVFLTPLGTKGYMWMFYFQQKIAVAIIKVKKQHITFSNPTPEALPVLTLGIYSKGQVRTNPSCTMIIHDLIYFSYSLPAYFFIFSHVNSSHIHVLVSCGRNKFPTLVSLYDKNLLIFNFLQQALQSFLFSFCHVWFLNSILPSSVKPQPQLQLGRLSWLYFHITQPPSEQ